MSADDSVKNLEGRGTVRPARRAFLGWLGAVAGAIAIGAGTASRALAANIPMPDYLPESYVLRGTYTGSGDGFLTGKDEIKFLYVNPRNYALRIKSPLMIYVSPMTDKPFWGTVGKTPEVISLTIGDRTTEANYFVGLGHATDEFNSAFNSLIFPLAGFMIGIRGTKKGGVDRSELIRIASSFKLAG